MLLRQYLINRYIHLTIDLTNFHQTFRISRQINTINIVLSNFSVQIYVELNNYHLGAMKE